jgi:hypothetical protein
MGRAPPDRTRERICAAFGRLLHLFNIVLCADKAHRAARRAAYRAVSRPGSGGHNFLGTKGAYKRVMTPEQFWLSDWGSMIRDPDVSNPGSRAHRKFELEFRVPYAIFKDIVHDARDQAWARSSTKKGRKCRGRPCMPLEAKVLSCLYRLGCGCLARTQASLFGMSPSCAQQVFKDFCAWYAQKYYDECTVPETEQECRDVEEIYAKLGFPGCLGSVDGVHLHWARCPHKLLARHKGSKGVPTRYHDEYYFVFIMVHYSIVCVCLSKYLHVMVVLFLSRSFNVTVDHRRFVRHISCSKPGVMNDKTSVRYDPHITNVRRGLYKDFRFKVSPPACVGNDVMPYVSCYVLRPATIMLSHILSTHNPPPFLIIHGSCSLHRYIWF